MVETALTARASLRAAAVPDLRPLLEKVPRAERGKLINQSSLGLGSPRARIVIVGQEHAYDLDDIEKLAVEGCDRQDLGPVWKATVHPPSRRLLPGS